jgi:protease-4
LRGGAGKKVRWGMRILKFAVGLAVLGMSLSACGRASVTFTLNPEPLSLDETTVMGAEGAGQKVALMEVRGMIIDAAQRGFLTPASNPVDELTARLERAEQDAAVKAVVIRINSPGGSVTASDTMYREVRRFRERSKKPVVMSMGEVAASGGYYLALAGDEILAQPTTITGSIGVIMPTINVSQGMSRIGIVSRSIKSGANKDLANPLEPMREGQYALLQGMIDEFYARFRGLVLERREAVMLGLGNDPSRASSLRGRADEVMDGRVVSGAEAVRLGLVDKEGDVRDAFAEAQRLAGISSARLLYFI